MLPVYIETDEDWDAWETRLLECEKDDLVQFLLARMSADRSLMHLAAASFGEKEPANVPNESDLAIANYCREIDEETSEMVPDVDYLISFTERFFQEIEKMPVLPDQIKSYTAVIIKLSDAIAKGAGLFHEEYELLVDEMKDAAAKMISLLKNKDRKSSDGENEKERALRYLMQQAGTYKVVIENYLQMVIDAVK